MQKVFRILGLVTIFAFMVGCCAKKMPMIQAKRDVPIHPESVLFIGASNTLTGAAISGSAIVVGEEEEWSWAISAGHVCYPEPQDTLVMLADVWLSMAFTFHGEYAPMTMIALDQENDICIFKVPMTGLPNVKLADSMPQIGDKVYLLSLIHI